VTIAAAEDRLHLPEAPDPAFHDALTFAFGDPAAKLYGVARISCSGDSCNGFAIVYADGRPVVTSAGRGSATGDPPAWDGMQAAGVRVSVLTALEAWTVTFAGEDGGFDLRFDACSAPAVLDAEHAVVRTGGMQGYEQLCRVSGTVTHGGRTHGVRCLGQRGQLWGSPDWGRIELVRSVSAWLGDDRALTLMAVRPAKSKGHLDEAVGGFLFEGGAPVAIDDPRLSTTYDGAQHQRRAGLELWMAEDAPFALRMAGEVLCETTLDLGDKRLHSAFFRWRMDGREGVGRYDVVRRADGGGGRRRPR
jgi:hypothetical protein